MMGRVEWRSGGQGSNRAGGRGEERKKASLQGDRGARAEKKRMGVEASGAAGPSARAGSARAREKKGALKISMRSSIGREGTKEGGRSGCQWARPSRVRSASAGFKARRGGLREEKRRSQRDIYNLKKESKGAGTRGGSGAH